MSRSGRSRDDPFAFLRRADTTLVRAEPSPPVTVTRYAEIGPEAIVDGTWRLKTRLGHGAFGVVYEAARVDDPEDYVAIKLIAPEPGGDDDPWARRVMQEVEVATSLRHPNIVH
ncbi:MAG: protein kinase, partial [Myxococcales bacterium]|nr:protein kinase [Myxococcales bacterium]